MGLACFLVPDHELALALSDRNHSVNERHAGSRGARDAKPRFYSGRNDIQRTRFFHRRQGPRRINRIPQRINGRAENFATQRQFKKSIGSRDACTDTYGFSRKTQKLDLGFVERDDAADLARIKNNHLILARSRKPAGVDERRNGFLNETDFAGGRKKLLDISPHKSSFITTSRFVSNTFLTISTRVFSRYFPKNTMRAPPTPVRSRAISKTISLPRFDNTHPAIRSTKASDGSIATSRRSIRIASSAPKTASRSALMRSGFRRYDGLEKKSRRQSPVRVLNFVRRTS